MEELQIGRRLCLSYTNGQRIRFTCAIRWHICHSRAIDRRLCFTRATGRSLHHSRTIGRRLHFTREIGQRLHYSFAISVISVPLRKSSLSLSARGYLSIFLPRKHHYTRFKEVLPYSRLGLINLFTVHAIALQLHLLWEGEAKGLLVA